MPISPMPDSRAFSSTGWRPVIGFEPSRMLLLSQSYQPPGVIAIIARSYQPVLAAVRSTFSAFRWVLRPRCATLPACLAFWNARWISSLSMSEGLCEAIR